MNVLELGALADWYDSVFKKISGPYTKLHNVLEHNASQPNRQEVTPALDRLVAALRTVDLGLLSIQQLGVLDELEVRELLGQSGVDFVESSIKTSTYDPATSEKHIAAARQYLSSANDKLNGYREALTNLGMVQQSFEPEADRIIIRIGFRNDAAIKNVIDLKNSSRDWFDIIRGLALAVGEAPENTEVRGASTGSVILILSSTAILAKCLALISKYVTQIAKDVISVAAEVENLKQKRMLTKTMEAEFKAVESNIREEGLKALANELNAMVPADAQGDVKAAIEKSVEKLLKFGEKGGDVDFVAPPSTEGDAPDEQNGEDVAAGPNDIEQVRQLILEYQRVREDVRLLEDGTQRDVDAG